MFEAADGLRAEFAELEQRLAEPATHADLALARHTLAAYPPDLFIEVPRNVCRSLEFHRANEVIEIGRELGAAALDTLGTSES